MSSSLEKVALPKFTLANANFTIGLLKNLLYLMNNWNCSCETVKLTHSPWKNGNSAIAVVHLTRYMENYPLENCPSEDYPPTLNLTHEEICWGGANLTRGAIFREVIFRSWFNTVHGSYQSRRVLESPRIWKEYWKVLESPEVLLKFWKILEKHSKFFAVKQSKGEISK